MAAPGRTKRRTAKGLAAGGPFSLSGADLAIFPFIASIEYYLYHRKKRKARGKSAELVSKSADAGSQGEKRAGSAVFARRMDCVFGEKRL
jgi:hypothetical protein